MSEIQNISWKPFFESPTGTQDTSTLEYVIAASLWAFDLAEANFDINVDIILGFDAGSLSNPLLREKWVALKQRLLAYKANELAKLEAQSPTAKADQVSRSANRWTGIDDAKLQTIKSKITATVEIFKDTIEAKGGEITERMILGAALMVAADEKDEILDLLNRNRTRTYDTQTLLVPLEFLAAQIVMTAAFSPALEETLNKKVTDYTEAKRIQQEAIKAQHAKRASEIMYQVESFLIRNIMQEGGRNRLKIADIGEFFYDGYLFSFNPKNVHSKMYESIVPDDVIIIDEMELPVGEVYARIIRESVISPFSAGYVAGRVLTDDHQAKLSAYIALRLKGKVVQPLHHDHPLSRFDYEPGLGFTAGNIDKPYKGPTITIVSREGEVFKILEGQQGRINLVNGDAVQIGSDEPFYVGESLERSTPRGRIFDIPITRDLMELEMEYDPQSGRVMPNIGAETSKSDLHGRCYNLPLDILFKETDSRNLLFKQIREHDNILKILELDPQDLIGKTLSEMKRTIEKAAKNALAANHSDRNGGLDTDDLKRKRGHIASVKKYFLRIINDASSIPSQITLINPSTKIEKPKIRPAQRYSNPKEIIPHTAHHSFGGAIFGLWLMISSSFSNLGTAGVDTKAVTTPTHPIELRDDSRNGLDERRSSIVERRSAVARRLSAQARLKTARLVRG